MKGSIVLKLFVVFCMLSFALCSCYANEEFDYNKYRAKTSLQNEFADYMQSVKEKIEQIWITNNTMPEGKSTIVFKINRFGDVVATNVKLSSGNSFFDESAIETIQKAAPFDKFPSSTTRDFITIQYNFEASVVNTDKIQQFIQQSDYYLSVNDTQRAKQYVDLAIKEIQGDCASYFLYAKRAKLNKALGNEQAALDDIAEFERLKPIYDQRRIATTLAVVNTTPTPFAYFALANAYDIAGDYENSIKNIDKAIAMTPLNHSYIRYRAEMIIRHNK